MSVKIIPGTDFNSGLYFIKSQKRFVTPEFEHMLEEVMENVFRLNIVTYYNRYAHIEFKDNDLYLVGHKMLSCIRQSLFEAKKAENTTVNKDRGIYFLNRMLYNIYSPEDFGKDIYTGGKAIEALYITESGVKRPNYSELKSSYDSLKASSMVIRALVSESLQSWLYDFDVIPRHDSTLEQLFGLAIKEFPEMFKGPY